MKLNILRFYASLIFLYFSDMSLLITVMWISYEITNSPFFLGLMLSISALLPILFKKINGKINLLSLSIPDLMKLRIVIYTILAFIVHFAGESIYGLMLLSVLTGVLSVTILSTYEAENIRLVLNNQIDKSLSARIMQTVIQVGAFSGAITGSFVLKSVGFENTVLLISFLDISVCLIMYFFERKNVLSAKESIVVSSSMEINQKKNLYLLSSLLGMIALHISTFNLTVPIIFQDINHWSVEEFGLASGAAGLGAFISVFFKNSAKSITMLLFAFVVFDLLFTFNKISLLVLPYCFIIGFCMNSTRVFIREMLIGIAENSEQSHYIAGISSVVYMLYQSLGSVFLGILIGIISMDHFNQLLLPFIAFLILLLFFSIKNKVF